MAEQRAKEAAEQAEAEEQQRKELEKAEAERYKSNNRNSFFQFCEGYVFATLS